jgi:hypothetical protein
MLDDLLKADGPSDMALVLVPVETEKASDSVGDPPNIFLAVIVSSVLLIAGCGAGTGISAFHFLCGFMTSLGGV